jgi:rod shape-determining protein MreD
MRNFIWGIFVMTTLALVQSAILPIVRPTQGRPELVLVAVLAWNLASQRPQALLWALIGGILLDTLSVAPFGSTTLSLFVLAAITNIIGNQISGSQMLFAVFVTAFGTLLYHLSGYLLLQASGWQLDFGYVLRTISIPSLFFNCVLMLLVYPLATWLNQQIWQAEIKG